MKGSGLAKMMIGGAIGAAASYLCDPARGRARRARLRDQARAGLRREARTVARKARYERGRLAGVAHRLNGVDHPPESDHVLLDRVRSEVLGRMPELSHRISSDACNGVITLRGALDDAADIERVVTAVCRAPGVSRVESFLHLPGQDAPNKAGALHTG